MQRFRHAVVVGDGVVLSRKLEWALRKTAAHDVDTLNHPIDTNAGRVVGDPGLFVVGLHPARADTQFDASLGKDIHRCDLFCKNKWVLVVVVPNECAKAQR